MDDITLAIWVFIIVIILISTWLLIASHFIFSKKKQFEEIKDEIYFVVKSAVLKAINPSKEPIDKPKVSSPNKKEEQKSRKTTIIGKRNKNRK